MPGFSQEEERQLLLSVGTHRAKKGRKLSPVEVGHLIQKAIDSGASRKECASRFQIGSTQISAFLDLLKVAPEIRDLADWGGSASTIAFSSLALLAGLKEHADQRAAAQAILANKLSWKEVVQLVQQKNRSGERIQQCIEAILKLRPQIERRHVFVGSVTDDEVRARLSKLPQSERDALFGPALRKALGPAEDFAGRLGVDRFTIVGPRNPAEVAGVGADELEAAINAAIAEAADGEAVSD